MRVSVSADHGSELSGGEVRCGVVDVGSREARYHSSSTLNAAAKTDHTADKERRSARQVGDEV